MKIVGYIVVGYLLLQLFQKQSVFTNLMGAPVAAPVTTASGATLTPVQTPLTAPNNQQIFLDDSGDLVTINTTGGTTVLPDPNGIGGGFAT